MRRSTIKTFIYNANEKHDYKYDYSLVVYINNKTKVKIICPIHGEFEQNPNSHLYYGCKECGDEIGSKKRSITPENYIKKFRLTHGYKYDYSLANCINIRSKIKIICPKHGEFEQMIESHIKHGCNKCGYEKAANKLKKDNEWFISKSNLTHDNIYDYSLVEYINNHSKVKIICSEHSEFEQSPSDHINGSKCPKCSDYNRKILLTSDKLSFISSSKNIHDNKYDYPLVDYINSKIKVKIICKKHGEFKQTPNDHLSGHGCPICNESKGENEIRKYLTENKIKFNQQHKFSDCKYINPLPFDFYLPEFNICVEFNGRQHYEQISHFGGLSEFNLRQIRDRVKIDYCNKNNIKLLIIKYTDKVNETLIENIKYSEIKNSN